LSQRELFHQKILGGMSMKDGEIDIYKKLSDSYSAIFTTRKFIGSRPRNGNGAYLPPYFYITDGENEYEIAEMSAGERAIFPLLVDFSNLTINNSIVLIDEIELHLHPPLQQSFLNALSKLGENNQFIITTHSDYIATMIPAENKIYL
jgi:predicted ATPase